MHGVRLLFLPFRICQFWFRNLAIQDLVYKPQRGKFDWNNPERSPISARDLRQPLPSQEGDFHRLRIQEIEDMLLLLVQWKGCVEDLQLGVESYQKKTNLSEGSSDSPERDGIYPGISIVSVDVLRSLVMKSSYIRVNSFTMMMEILLDVIIKHSSWYGYFAILYDSTCCRTTGKNRCVRSIRIKLVPGKWITVVNQFSISIGEIVLMGLLLSFNTSAGNPVKKILLKLNLLSTRVNPQGFARLCKMVVELPDSSWLTRS
ncbi:hypothetical protein Tco_0292243 [Tanacetum coccineum]